MLGRLYKILEIPFVYRLTKLLLAPGGVKFRKPIYERVLNAQTQRVLDIGCGPDLTTPEPQGLIVGVDVNKAYIRDYTGGFLDENLELVLRPPPSRRRLGFTASVDRLPFQDGLFDEVRSVSLFHHLSDEQVVLTLREAKRCLRTGGRIVVFDIVLPVRIWRRPVAWLILRMDRGRYVRKQERLLELFQNALGGPWKWERHTYTYTGMELLCLQYVKK